MTPSKWKAESPTRANPRTTAPFQVVLYASPVRGIDKYSVPIGEVTIPAGLAPGQIVPYQTSVQLPVDAHPRRQQ